MSGKRTIPHPVRTASVALTLALACIVPAASAPAPAAAYTAFELVSAGVTYHWYPLKWRYEFKGGRVEPKAWHLGGRGRQYQQNGMLTLVGRAGTHTRDVTSTWSGVGYRTGRWETRIRTRTYNGGTPFRLQLSLIPARKGQRFCGAQDVHFLTYSPAHSSTYAIKARSMPNRAFTYSRKLSRSIGHDQWHVFGVEVTRKRIAWFVDGKVSAIEKAPSALTGVAYTMQAALVPTSGARMQKTRLQLDWARYWTMHKKGSPLGSAPSPRERTSKATC